MLAVRQLSASMKEKSQLADTKAQLTALIRYISVILLERDIAQETA